MKIATCVVCRKRIIWDRYEWLHDGDSVAEVMDLDADHEPEPDA